MASETLSASCTKGAHSVRLSSLLEDLRVVTSGRIDMLSLLRMKLLLQLQLTRPSCDAAVSGALLGLRGTDSELKHVIFGQPRKESALSGHCYLSNALYAESSFNFNSANSRLSRI